MLPLASAVSRLLALSTLLADVIILLFLAYLILRRFSLWPVLTSLVNTTIGRQAMLLSFLTSLGAIIASLFYSEVAGFEPCVLCWWQRIFIYPQVVILGIGLLKKDPRAIDYSITLSVPGAVVAAYHTYIQFGGAPVFSCGATATAVSCTQRLFLEYGYITIPTMSLTIFLLTIILGIAYKSRHPRI